MIARIVRAGVRTLIPLHTGTHTGLWGAIEVAFAVGVLLVSVGLVARLLLESREGGPGVGLAEALSRGGSRDEDTRSREGPPLDRRSD